MPPIPIYSQSPISAAKASGVTPQTAEALEQQTPASGDPPTTTKTLPSQGYPAPQPGAVPTLPVATPQAQAAQRYAPAPLQPTPTQKLDDSQNPPPPQPGAVPAPAASRTTLPPPPRAGEKLQQLPQQTAPVPYPAQMSVPAPTAPHVQQGTATATANTPSRGTLPVQLPGGAYFSTAEGISHPAGYQQNVNASDFTSNQRAAHNALSQEERRRSDYEEEGVWSSAMKWAQAAGEKLSEAESEVWKRINKE